MGTELRPHIDEREGEKRPSSSVFILEAANLAGSSGGHGVYRYLDGKYTREAYVRKKEKRKKMRMERDGVRYLHMRLVEIVWQSLSCTHTHTHHHLLE